LACRYFVRISMVAAQGALFCRLRECGLLVAQFGFEPVNARFAEVQGEAAVLAGGIEGAGFP
jgi:hypothetical protein